VGLVERGICGLLRFREEGARRYSANAEQGGEQWDEFRFHGLTLGRSMMELSNEIFSLVIESFVKAEDSRGETADGGGEALLVAFMRQI
jgi:hypothetical protein